jgi:hypothetical protein
MPLWLLPSLILTFNRDVGLWQALFAKCRRAPKLSAYRGRSEVISVRVCTEI